MNRWRPVPEFETTYEISDRGEVRRIAPPKMPIRTRTNTQNGYVQVSLRTCGRQFTRYVHRLVLHAFEGPPVGNVEAAHLNGQRTDNRIENLKWATRVENLGHKIAHGTSQHGERNHQARLTAADVIVIRQLHADGHTQCSIAAVFGLTFQSVHDIVRRKRWKHIPVGAELDPARHAETLRRIEALCAKEGA